MDTNDPTDTKASIDTIDLTYSNDLIDITNPTDTKASNDAFASIDTNDPIDTNYSETQMTPRAEMIQETWMIQLAKIIQMIEMKW